MAIGSVNTNISRIGTTGVQQTNEVGGGEVYDAGIAAMMLSYQVAQAGFNDKIASLEEKTRAAEQAGRVKAELGLLSNRLADKADTATLRDDIKQTTLAAFDKAFESLKGPPVQWDKISAAVDLIDKTDSSGAGTLRDLVAMAQGLESIGMPSDMVNKVATGKFTAADAATFAGNLDDKIKNVQVSQVEMMKLNQSLNVLNTYLTVANKLLDEKKSLKQTLLRG